MEKTIRLKGTEDTPAVEFDLPAKQMVINGRSMPEDALAFYAPLQKWVDYIIQSAENDFTFNIQLDYFNSKSLKQIIRMLIKLEAMVKAGRKLKVVWRYDDGDELMLMKGQEIKSIVQLPFELQPISS